MPRIFLLSVMSALVAGAALLGACFDKPEPACAFWCGVQSACPEGYRCAADQWCKREDVAEDFECGPSPTQDAAPAPPDATPGDAADATPSDAADATPSDATPSDATPSDATPSDATPSDAAPVPAIDAALPDANGAGLR